MGAGGAAPPVKSEDVMILIGSTILLTMLVIQAWSTPTTIECYDSSDIDAESGDCETFEVKFDLSEGDIFTLEVFEGQIQPTVVLPSGDYVYLDVQEKEWEYSAENSGVHTFIIAGIDSDSDDIGDDAVIDFSVSRGILIDYGLYPIGALILVFGILKRISNRVEDEPMEAVLDD